MKRLLLSGFIALVSFTGQAQYKYRDSNRIGIGVGLNQFSLNTKNFDTKPGNGWNIGLSVRGNFYNDFDMVYGIRFSENNFKAETMSPTGFAQDVNFKLPSAQISLLLSYKIIENHLSVELGPMFQVNGELIIEDRDKNNTINGTLQADGTQITAEEMTKISKFNFYPTIGITGGITHVRLNLTYQYGITNMLGGLSADGFGGQPKGRGSILSGGILFYL